EVSVDEDHTLGCALPDRAPDRLPLGAVSQQVDDALEARVRGDAEVERRHRGPRFTTTEQIDRELTLLLEQAGAARVARPSGAGDHDLQTTGVEHHALSPVDRPAIRRRGSALEGPDDELALELEIVTARLSQEL